MSNKTYLELAKEQLTSPLDYILNSAKRLQITNCKETINAIGEEIKIEIDNINFQINNISYLEQIDNSKLELKRNNVDFDRLINKVLDDISHLTKIRQIKIEIDSHKSNEFSSDVKMLYTILVNLIANAIEFSYNNTTIHVVLFEGHDNFKFIVKNDGRGIKNEISNKIFDKFYQANDRVIRIQKTQGLGLFIVKNLVDFLQGSIEFDSKENGTTIFEITLPKL
ncbi:hypothetical protein CRV08_02710 [Halarcobacter ebronensis]|uniref:histidine kinase n=1 Tax=Halarcobacter ebronensis TaxID=1462615 RepID=A0A4Q0YIL0_9BACT|nr:HAMP domain-containing sensor histidine kinase [Halarcobacter ebronensis]RXJ69634.1 hypothetical protein CRV08_02710 [Halarcobacter ebronensis]